MSQKKSENSIRIAKNATALYVRMIIATIVTLYTSRIVLNELGVEGYGTYTLVAGIVTFWLFLNGSMTTASTRFLSIALERGGDSEISKVFTSVFWTHIIIAILLIALGETVGLWFFLNKLKIIPELYLEAKVVYHLSIISVTISVIQVPFTSMCIAQERMGIFAKLEFLNSGLKLISGGVLILVTSNKLIIYASFIALSAFILFICYFLYCKYKFRNCILIQKYRFSEIKDILSFTSWDLYNNGAVSLRMQGTSVLYNFFINTTANAALGISLQVQGVITSLANNIAMSIRPQITKSYVSTNNSYMEQLVISGSKLMATMVLIFIIPLLIETQFVLYLWLGECPDYTVWFIRLTLLSIYFWTFSTLSHSIIHATGKVKKYSLISGTLILSEVLIMYVTMKFTHFAYIPQILRIIMLIILGIIMLRIIKYYIPNFNIKRVLGEIYLRGTLTLCVCFIVPYAISNCFEPGWPQLLAVCITSLFWIVGVVWIILLSIGERSFYMNFLKQAFGKNIS